MLERKWMSNKVHREIEFDNIDQLMNLFGNFDENLKSIEEETNTTIVSNHTTVRIIGQADDVTICENLINSLFRYIKKGEKIDATKISYATDLSKEGNSEAIHELMEGAIAVTSKGRQIRCKTLTQKKYIDEIKKKTLVFCVGPAGTGKTYLAVAMAVKALKNKEIQRIILTRPAVEAGEKLGFLPGDLQNKVDPYLRPLYDALYDFLGGDTFARHLESGVIEVAPLAYMRGRTLNDSFIILDEAQNCTRAQMKMFLTRFGEGSNVIVNGDVTQIDLPKKSSSGLVHVVKVLRKVEDIGIINFTHRDVVRHKLVQKIIKAYEKYENDSNRPRK
jgi:phosphate starvation-inducible protein PhoH and related proteins